MNIKQEYRELGARIASQLGTKLVKSQVKTETKMLGGKRCIRAFIRYDDQCGNGHNSFSITGEIYDGNIRGSDKIETCGCIHEEIARHFPHLAPLLKWHLTSADGPIHYFANVIYHAGNRDYHGLLKGESRQLVNGKDGKPSWHLVAVGVTGEEELHKLEKYIDSDMKPTCAYSLEYRPWCRIGDGKERELKFARDGAVWPEATDAELSVESDELADKLAARLPALIAEFKKDVEESGFTY